MAQAGVGSFGYLDLPYSSRLGALGGSQVSHSDGELASAMCNPALLTAQTDKVLSLSYAYYGLATNFASVAYGHNWGYNYFAAGVHYLDYGRFDYRDEWGMGEGATFSARDILIDVIYARQLHSNWRVGVSLKPMMSFYETYSSFALGADVGIHYQTSDSLFHLGLSLQNIGWQLKGFYNDMGYERREALPINLQLGLDYHLPHAPLRFYLTLHHLQKWDLSYTDQVSDKEVKWIDKLFRHAIIGVEIVPKNNKFYLTAAYNHRRNRDLTIANQMSMAGFSFGAGITQPKFRLGVSMAQYTRRNFTFQATFALDINNLLQ